MDSDIKTVDDTISFIESKDSNCRCEIIKDCTTCEQHLGRLSLIERLEHVKTRIEVLSRFKSGV